MAKTRGPLTRQELAIMQLVWQRRSATVREVYEALRESRQVAYTTVMTMMNVLERKGHLRKEPDGRAFRYRPTRAEHAVVGSMVRDFVNRVFNGASQPLMLHLLSEGRLTEAERKELMRLIKEAGR